MTATEQLQRDLRRSAALRLQTAVLVQTAYTSLARTCALGDTVTRHRRSFLRCFSLRGGVDVSPGPSSVPETPRSSTSSPERVFDAAPEHLLREVTRSKLADGTFRLGVPARISATRG